MLSFAEIAVFGRIIWAIKDTNQTD